MNNSKYKKLFFGGEIMFNDTTSVIVDELLKNSICKESHKAEIHERLDHIPVYDRYRKAIKEEDDLSTHVGLTFEDIHNIVPRVSMNEIETMLNDMSKCQTLLTNVEYSKLLIFSRNKIISTYVETNDYYRMLYGLPDYKTPESEFIYVDGEPIHKISMGKYYEIKFSGKLDSIIADNPDKPYLFYIGKQIEPFYARESKEYDLLFVPSNDVKYEIFRKCYNKERLVFMKTIHSEYLVNNTDYAEARELTTLKLQAVLLYLIESQSNELDKTEYTVEEAINIWKTFGLTYPNKMPTMYRNTITFLLNYLTSMKGTNAVVEYISTNLFKGIKLYKYMIRKTTNNITFPIPEGTRPEDVYTVEFILRPFYATNIVDFKENGLQERVLSYDDVVAMDPRWSSTDELKKAIFSSDFSYTDSKYLSIDNLIDMGDFGNTFSILMSLLINNKDILNSKTVLLEYINTTNKFFDVLVYYLALMFRFLEHSNAFIPESLESISSLYGFEIPENLPELRVHFAEYFLNTKYASLMDEMPDCIATNESFFSFLLKVDKCVSLNTMLVDLKNEARNQEEYDLIEDIYRLVKSVNASPEPYGVSKTLNGMTYLEWLTSNNDELALRYAKVVTDKNSLMNEIDNVSQSVINAFNEMTGDASISNVTGVLNTFNTMSNGISKYLLYILKLFKSYSSEFLNESVSYTYGEKYNLVKQLDKISIRGTYNRPMFQNNTDWDSVVITRKSFKPLTDMLTQTDLVYLNSPFGDVKLNK